MVKLLALLLLVPTTVAAQDWVAGVEASDAASYTYVTHYSRSGPIHWWQSVSYLTYRLQEGSRSARVNSPGLSTGVMYRWSRRAYTAGLGAGYETRWTERRWSDGMTTNLTESGPIVEGDAGARLTRTVSARLAGRLSGANDWFAVSGDLRKDLSRRLRVGPQVILQGNDDVKVTSYGGFVEVPMGATALQVRAGQSRIKHRDGSRESKPYLSAGIIVPF